MSPSRPGAAAPASVLVADDDPRVRQLLEIALTAHGFRVIVAADGDEAVRRVLGERPDLVVLDVRLPKKSGLQVCELLRGDAEDPSVPIMLVSAAGETDARLQGFARGADDYLAKPFSPKELIARVRRLLLRAAETRMALRRAQDLERELIHAQSEARRAQVQSRREQRLLELTLGLGRDLLATPDLDALARRLLLEVQSMLGVGTVGLLMRRSGDTSLGPIAVRGDGFERIAALELEADGELARVLAGLGRPVPRAELERLSELRDELAPFVAAGLTLLVPLRADHGLDALLVMDERLDGGGPSRAEVEGLSGACEIAAVAIRNGLRLHAQVDRMLGMVAEIARHHDAIPALPAEAGALALGAARAAGLPVRQRELLGHAVRLGPWALSPEGRRSLAGMRALDPTGRVEELERLLDLAAPGGNAGDEPAPEERRAAEILAAALSYVTEGARGAEGIDPAIRAFSSR